VDLVLVRDCRTHIRPWFAAPVDYRKRHETGRNPVVSVATQNGRRYLVYNGLRLKTGSPGLLRDQEVEGLNPFTPTLEERSPSAHGRRASSFPPTKCRFMAARR
jgi:hypothetical protein